MTFQKMPPHVTDTHPKSPRLYYLLYAGVILSVFLLFIYTSGMEGEEQRLWLAEGGLIESLSAVGYLVCALLILYWGRGAYLKHYNYYLILVVAFFLRELDFDKKFTTMGILKSKFYISDTVPLGEKLIGLLVVAILAYIVISIIRKDLKPFLSGLASFSAFHIGVSLAFLFLVLAKTLDGIARKLRDIGIHIEKMYSDYASTLEEVLELAIPIILILVFHEYFVGMGRSKA